MAIKSKDYLAVARQKVHRPATRKHYPKLMIYARNKKGKTTLSLSAGVETTILLDPEAGTDAMKAKNPYIWPIEKWEDLQDAYGALRTGQLSPKVLGQGKSDVPFQWVSVDGLTRMNNMALRYVMSVAEERDLDRKPGLVDRRDYNKSGELMKQMLNNFHSLKMGVIYTAQERMTTLDSGDHDEDEETTFFVPDLPAGVRGAANSLVDLIARLYVARVTLKDGKTKAQRRLQIGPHERYDTGFRSDFALPDMIRNPTIPKLVTAMVTGELE